MVTHDFGLIAPSGLHDIRKFIVVCLLCLDHTWTCAFKLLGASRNISKQSMISVSLGKSFLMAGGNDSKDEIPVRPFDEKMKLDVCSIEPFPKIPFLRNWFTSKYSFP